MLLSIDPHNGLAVYDQIVRQVKFAVADGVVRSGEFVPSVREMARDVAVNPNTVARAYRELQQQEVLAQVRGTGLAVTSTARRRCQGERTRLIRARLAQVLAEAHQSGLTHEEVEQIVTSQLQSRGRKVEESKG